MKKNFVNELALTLAKINDTEYRKRADQIIADYIYKSDDIDFITTISTSEYIYNDEEDIVNLIDLAMDFKFEHTLCAVIEKYPQLVTNTENHYPTIIHRAVKNGMESVGLKALDINAAWAEIPDFYGQTFVHVAMERRFEKIGWKTLKTIPKIASIQDSNKNTFAHIAMKKGLYSLGLQALADVPEISTLKNSNNRTIMQESQHCEKIKNNFLKINEKGIENLLTIIYNRSKDQTETRKADTKEGS